MKTYQPLSTQERIPMVDALRGSALLGIILANVPAAAALQSTDYFLVNSYAVNGQLQAIFHVLISTKFFTIFSVLFGFGFYVQLTYAAQRGINFRRYFVTRMLLLFLIGCLHAYLLMP